MLRLLCILHVHVIAFLSFRLLFDIHPHACWACRLLPGVCYCEKCCCPSPHTGLLWYMCRGPGLVGPRSVEVQYRKMMLKCLLNWFYQFTCTQPCGWTSSPTFGVFRLFKFCKWQGVKRWLFVIVICISHHQWMFDIFSWLYVFTHLGKPVYYIFLAYFYGVYCVFVTEFGRYLCILIINVLQWGVLQNTCFWFLNCFCIF